MNEIDDWPALAQEPELSPDRLASRLSRLVATRSVNGVDAETELAHRIAAMLDPAARSPARWCWRTTGRGCAAA